MHLCENRVEGFGPHSTINPHLPTDCFSDVIVIPLATWIYLFALAVVAIPASLLARRGRRDHQHAQAGNEQYKTEAGVATGNPHRGRRTLSKALVLTLRIIYYFLIVAMLAMVSLVIARLSVAQLGIGLLPFTYAGVVLAFLTHVTTESSTTRPGRTPFAPVSARWLLRPLNALFWLMLLATMAIKVSTDQMLIDKGYLRTGQQAMYKLSDEVIDNATMVGVEFVLALLELIAF